MSAARNEIKDLWAQVRLDKSPLRWCVAKGNDKTTDLEPCASGTSGLSGMVEALKAHEGIMFGGIRVAAIDERGTVTSIRPKFIKFMLITSTVGGMKRAKAQNLQVIADDIFQPTHCSFNIDDIAELTPEDIQRKLTLSAGAHLPNRYEFEGREENLEEADAAIAAAEAAAAAAPAASVLSPPTPPSSPLYVAPAVVAAQHPAPNVAEAVAVAAEEKKAEEEAEAKKAEEPAAEAAPAVVAEEEKKVEETPAPAPVVVEAPKPVVVAAPAPAPAAAPSPVAASPKTPASPASPNTAAAISSITEAWAQVQSDTAAPNFIVVACEGRDEKSAKVVALENGNLEAFKACFEEDKVMFGGFRMRAIDDRGSVLSIRTKYIFVSFIGPNVKPLLRANAGTLRSRFEQIINGCHLSFAVTEMDDIVESEITTRLLACGGAHSPNTWDYSGKKDINSI